jgi:hypothetical protein
MLLPKIIYSGTTLNFTFPPINKPASTPIEAHREDTVTITGKVQSMYLRTDDFFTLEMSYVPAANVAAWMAFLRYAVTGASFDYYPDATSGTHTTYMLDDAKFAPARAMFGGDKFSLRFRKVG